MRRALSAHAGLLHCMTSALLVVVSACGSSVHAAFVAATLLGWLPALSFMTCSGRRLDLVAIEVSLL